MNEQERMINQILNHIRTNSIELLKENRNLNTGTVRSYQLKRCLNYSTNPNLQDLIDVASISLAQYIQLQIQPK